MPSEIETGLTLPTTTAFIGYHAMHRPDAAAIIQDGQVVSYSQFYDDVCRVVSVLRNLGLEPGQRAAVECPDFYLHWLLLLGCECLGVATFSFRDDEAESLQDQLQDMDAVFCFPDCAKVLARAVQNMDRAWIDATLAAEPERPLRACPMQADTPVRILRGSGTTGSTKWMVHTGRVREFRISQYEFQTAFDTRSRFLMVMNFSMQSFYAYLTGCLRRGGVCIPSTGKRVAEELVEHRITHVTLLPNALMTVLENLPSDYEKPAGLKIYTNGAAISKSVRERVISSLADELIDCYGANEIGPVSITGEDGTGTVLPGVRIQVVNDEDQPVANEIGRLRILSEGSVGGYPDNPEATREMFRDGWFYPGDLAVVTDERRFKLVGRGDDLLNVQGIKVAAQPIEEELLRNLPIEDVCLTSLPDENGIEQIWVVVVSQESNAPERLKEPIRPYLPVVFGSVNLIEAAVIPRTSNGKIQRRKLKEALIAARNRTEIGC